MKEGGIIISKVNMIMEDGLRESQRTWMKRIKAKSLSYDGPRYDSLSEPLQNALVDYLYSVGVRPEIGIAVEYLSWNKE